MPKKLSFPILDDSLFDRFTMQSLYFDLKSPKESFPGIIFGLTRSIKEIIRTIPHNHATAADQNLMSIYIPKKSIVWYKTE